MKIFQNFELIKFGVEICLMASMLPYVSTGIGAFEQLRWDLENRGTDADFDVPVLVLGVEVGQDRLPAAKQISFMADEVPPEVKVERYKLLTDKEHKKILETGLTPDVKHFAPPKKSRQKR